MKLVLNVDAPDDGDPQSPIPISAWDAFEPVLERELLELCPGASGYESVEISVTLVTPEGIRRINREYRNCDETTDVLSFPMWEGASSEGLFAPGCSMPVLPLGDVVICPGETARLHPELPAEEALCLMLAHSFLHLLGWDHDTEERQEAMWARQDVLKNRLMGVL